MSPTSIEFLQKNFLNLYLEDLKRLVKIPSVSFDGFDPKEVVRSASAVAELLRSRGLENVKILELKGAHPYVYGDWLHAPGAPTLLLYAHHDVQPPGRTELWESPPFEPTLRAGPGGQRMYARGSADDKAGIVVHTSAIHALLTTEGKLPVNVKVIIEGEEEVGSTHLEEFLMANRDHLQADILCLTDTSNFDCGVPALTVALRGLVEFEIEVRALKGAVHSGVWGGPIPDPAMALCKALAPLTDAQGQIAIPGVMEQVNRVSAKEKEQFARIPFDEADFRKQSGLVAGGTVLRNPAFPEVHPAIQVWRLPSLTVNAIQASSRTQAGNIINDVAWAKVTIRVVGGMNAQEVAEKLGGAIRANLPWGLEARVDCKGAVNAWATEPTGKAFEAAEVALEKGYGKRPLFLGCGGTIPFVKPFAEALGGAPALLIGVEDPYTNAHGENESLLVSDLEKACLSQIHLFHEIAARCSR